MLLMALISMITFIISITTVVLLAQCLFFCGSLAFVCLCCCC